MMCVNGSHTANDVVWSQTVTVSAGKTYEFAFWHSSWFLSGWPRATLSVHVNGSQLGSNFQAPGTTGVWQQWKKSWSSGTSTSATLEIRNVSTDDWGNDFALDDISFCLVNQSPSADAGADQQAIAGETVSFDGTGSTDPDGTIASYAWDFGDQSTGTGATTTHAYSAAGSHTVTLTVTDDDGATDADTLTVTVQTPVAAIQDLVTSVKALGLPKGLQNSLVKKLEGAVKALNKGNAKAAKGKLGAFVNQVKAKRGKDLTETQADALVAAASRIAAVL
jgi:chitodextrinase